MREEDREDEREEVKELPTAGREEAAGLDLGNMNVVGFGAGVASFSCGGGEERVVEVGLVLKVEVVLKAEAAVEQVPRARARTSGTAVLTAVLLVRKYQVETLKKQLDSTRAESLQAKARHAVEIKQLAAATAAAWRKQAVPTK